MKQRLDESISNHRQYSLSQFWILRRIYPPESFGRNRVAGLTQDQEWQVARLKKVTKIRKIEPERMRGASVGKALPPHPFACAKCPGCLPSTFGCDISLNDQPIGGKLDVRHGQRHNVEARHQRLDTRWRNGQLIEQEEADIKAA